MSLIRHILAALAYAVIAVAAALAAPQLWPPVGQKLGAVLGGVVFVGCALMYQARTRQDQYDALAFEINLLRQHFTGAVARVPADGIGLIDGEVESQSALRDPLDLKIDFGQFFLFGEPREIRA